MIMYYNYVTNIIELNKNMCLHKNISSLPTRAVNKNIYAKYSPLGVIYYESLPKSNILTGNYLLN